jgi:hypothetical protein
VQALKEIQEDIEVEILCSECSQILDEDRYESKVCLDCQDKRDRQERKQIEDDCGVVDERDYRAGRGMSR